MKLISKYVVRTSPFMKVGLNSCNLAIRVRMRYTSGKGGVGLNGDCLDREGIPCFDIKFL